MGGAAGREEIRRQGQSGISWKWRDHAGVQFSVWVEGVGRFSIRLWG